ncbi:uncharacterized protein TNCT_730051 [Trichonephila clavata]|uniref:Uncharacterized protein n=1 Tax=Trichonephila clavata TaxID=2740835 RepID=A0A8X6F2G6_TRICU|nr:uncharacterized protein TNCT_730051 [Trichonephila clavata]
MSYIDPTNYQYTFLIQSPISYSDAIQQYNNVFPQAIMTTENGIPYDDVVSFLQDRFTVLNKAPFLCKGNSFQPNILKDAEIPYINVEKIVNIPSIRRLEQQFPYIDKRCCPFHKRPGIDKCAHQVVRLWMEFNKRESNKN